MDKSKVRIGLWIAGVLSGLFTALYLPVLIWSPPWGADGYYNSNKETVLYFSNGALSEYSIDEEFQIIRFNDQFVLSRDNKNQWALNEGTKLIFTKKTMEMKIGSESLLYQKVRSPIRIWEILINTKN